MFETRHKETVFILSAYDVLCLGLWPTAIFLNLSLDYLQAKNGLCFSVVKSKQTNYNETHLQYVRALLSLCIY